MSQPGSTEATRQLDALSDAYWEVLLKRNPTWATDLGDHRYDDRLPDLSPESRAEYFASLRALKQQLDALSAEGLTGQHAITHEVLTRALEVEVGAEPFNDEQWTINPLHGPVSWLTELAERQPIVPRENFDKLAARFHAVPNLFARAEEQLRIGIANGTVAPRIGAERVAAQIRRMLSIPPEQSAFMPPETVPDGVDARHFAGLKEELAAVVARDVYPSLARHADFLEQTYIPVSRERPGLCGMPGGGEFYQYLISVFTGLTDPAETIHQLGREELARIHAEMEAIGSRTYGDPDIRRLAARLHERPDQYLHDREALIAHNRALLERANAALPGYFSRLPERRCEVRAIEAFKEADSPSGYYCHAPDDGSRPAYYYVNTYKPEHRPLYNMEALAFHEAVPGHHLQIAIAQDLEGLPAFRRHTGQTAFIEGWALYSERLSDEMELYSNDFTRFGMLNYQAWRAARLVIDTGIHALGWTREKAVRELMDNTAHGEQESVIEVDRYTCMPGQALAYMIGRMQIDALRATAKARLGRSFDIKEFHARVLENGAVPLRSLTHLIHRWLDHAAG